jgi:uncharacterized protein YdeI (YjbR/CyaY-like superfamily)
MPTKNATALDPRIDAYIAVAAPFAKPVLLRVRDAMHTACPELTEDIKWSHPFFLLDGKPFANMAAFKTHCALGFWRGGKPIADAVAAASPDPREKAMGQFGRLETAADLPSAGALRRLIVDARDLALATRAIRASASPAPRVARERPAVPADLAAALLLEDAAQAAVDGFTASQQREYVEWVLEARREATRSSRIAQAVEWIAEGKTRNWKYQAC